MELFASRETLSQLEARLSSLPAVAPPLERLPLLVELAWLLRQQDCRRAQQLSDAALSMVQTEADGAQARLWQARLLLAQGEIQQLFGNLSQARQLVRQAADLFAAQEDLVGMGDASWIEASIAVDQGDGPKIAEHLDSALAAYRLADDPVRTATAHARALLNAAFTSPQAAAQQLRQHFPLGVERPALVSTFVAAAWANVAGLTNDPGLAIKQDLQAHALALETGQLRMTLVCLTNATEAFAVLGELGSALAWCEQALRLAREMSWPTSLGVCLMQMGDVMRLLLRPDEARSCIEEALSLMAAQSRSRSCGQALSTLGHLELDEGHHAAALQTFIRLEGQLRLSREPDLLVRAWRGQAHALFLMKRPKEALLKARQALEMATQHGLAEFQIQCQALLGQMQADRARVEPEGSPAARQAWDDASQHLHEALSLGSRIEGYTAAPELHLQVAAVLAAQGDHEAAYRHSLAAEQARQSLRNDAAQRQALALQIRHEIEQARADSAHHRELASALSETASTLETLGRIGQELTASLDTQAVFQALARHVHALLDANSFAIYELDALGAQLRLGYGIEAGTVLPHHELSIDDPQAQASRCARERCEIVLHHQPGDSRSPVLAGTAAAMSLMFAPLLVAERLLGVMTIQSPRAQAYGERERSILRTLCAYGAIALDNARAYTELHAAHRRTDETLQALQTTQAQLVQSEKMAVLGQLVANVAHEINTPIAAVKSSGRSIAEALDAALRQWPRLYRELDHETIRRFEHLCSLSRSAPPLLSSREDRAQRRELTRQLLARDIAEAAHRAELLMQLQATSSLDDILPLLQHPQAALILDTAVQVATMAQSTRNINDAVDRVSKIIQALKSYSHNDPAGRRVLTDLRSSLETVLTIYQHQLRHGVELVCQFEDGVPPLLCRPDELGQVWTNLIHNALHAMQMKGTLTIGLRCLQGQAVVTVQDSGCGIPEALQERIFEPFFTTKPIGEGSGLGLDIVKRIVTGHGGRISLQSSPGVGSCFEVWLPYPTVHTTADEPPATVSPPSDTPGIAEPGQPCHAEQYIDTKIQERAR